MPPSFRTLFRGAAFFGLTALIGIIGYCLAGWSLLDAVYMTVITVFGVGFGEVRPITEPSLRILTIFVIVAGCSSVIYFIGGIVQMIAEGEFHRALGARRMTIGIEQLKNHTIMCGFGRVGQNLARELRASGIALVIVDSDTERLAAAEADGYLVLVGDATDEAVLKTAGIERARVVATVLSSDAANIYLTLSARELNAEVEIIARAESPSAEKKLYRSGANRVVLPTSIGAAKIAQLISRPAAETLLSDIVGRQHLNDELQELGLRLQEFSLGANSELLGRCIDEVESVAKGHALIVAIGKPDGTVIRNPGSNLVLNSGDTLFALGHADEVLSLGRKAASRVTMYRGARG